MVATDHLRPSPDMQSMLTSETRGIVQREHIRFRTGEEYVAQLQNLAGILESKKPGYTVTPNLAIYLPGSIEPHPEDLIVLALTEKDDETQLTSAHVKPGSKLRVGEYGIDTVTTFTGRNLEAIYPDFPKRLTSMAMPLDFDPQNPAQHISVERVIDLMQRRAFTSFSGGELVVIADDGYLADQDSEGYAIHTFKQVCAIAPEAMDGMHINLLWPPDKSTFDAKLHATGLLMKTGVDPEFDPFLFYIGQSGGNLKLNAGMTMSSKVAPQTVPERSMKFLQLQFSADRLAQESK